MTKTTDFLHVYLICPHPSDATSWYRGVHPYAELHRSTDVSVTMGGRELSWVQLVGHDVLILQRPCGQAHVSALRMAKRLGIPVVCDFDDLLTDLPVSNPRYSVYMTQDVQACIQTCLQECDAIQTSTEHLRQAMGYPAKTTVVPNAWNHRTHPLPAKRPKPNPLVVWRGGSTHAGDLWSHRESLARAYRDHPEYRWVFIGEPDFRVFEAFPDELGSDRLQLIPSRDIGDYLATLQHLAPEFMVVPLQDSPFNRAKSNIAYLEATYAGAVTVAPAWDEWSGRGCATYGGADVPTLDQALTEAKGVDLWPIARKHATLLADANRTRLEVLRGVTGQA